MKTNALFSWIGFLGLGAVVALAADSSTPPSAPAEGGKEAGAGGKDEAPKKEWPEAEPPAPPGQPEKGPGGKDYVHEGHRVSRHGEGSKEYWIFEPAEPAPEEKAPVVIFLHGWSAMDPAPYGAWIRHLVRKGNIVIYPRYQAWLLTPPNAFTPAILSAVEDALKRLDEEKGRVRPDRDRVAVTGHSFGAALSFNYAALAEKRKLPRPKALFALEPGTGNERKERVRFDFADLSAIDPGTLVLIATGDLDLIAGENTAKEIWKKLEKIPKENRDFVRFRSDDHGRPALLANHFFPCAVDPSLRDPGEKSEPGGREKGPAAGERFAANALDHRGAWRLFDALMAAAFTGKGKEQCLGGTAEQKDLGKWSDGTPVKKPEVTDDP